MNNLQLNNENEPQVFLKKEISLNDVKQNKDLALLKISELIDKYMNNTTTLKKANNLSYWIRQYAEYLDFEDTFDSTRLKSYRYGDVIKVNLGYNIGDEEGGLHYCIVIDKNNSMHSKVITIIPLTSVKPNKKIHKTSVFLGDEIYNNLNSKHSRLYSKFIKEISEISRFKKDSMSQSEMTEHRTKISNAMNDLVILQKLEGEIEKMKQGSIALVNQITTVSKQRIYDPQKYCDILSGLSICDISLLKITNKIKQLFIKNFD